MARTCTESCDTYELPLREYKRLIGGEEWPHERDSAVGWAARKLQQQLHGAPPRKLKRSKLARQANVPIYKCGALAQAVNGGSCAVCARRSVTLSEFARLRGDPPWGHGFKGHVGRKATALYKEIYGKVPPSRRRDVGRAYPFGLIEQAYRELRAAGYELGEPRRRLRMRSNSLRAGTAA